MFGLLSKNATKVVLEACSVAATPPPLGRGTMEEDYLFLIVYGMKLAIYFWDVRGFPDVAKLNSTFRGSLCLSFCCIFVSLSKSFLFGCKV